MIKSSSDEEILNTTNKTPAQILQESVKNASQHESITRSEKSAKQSLHLSIIKTAVSRLPEVNKKILMRTMICLQHIVKHKDYNQMNSKNLAVCIGPALIWPPMTVGATEEAYSHTMILATPKIVKLVELIIDEFEQIFEEADYIGIKNSYKKYSRDWEEKQAVERKEQEKFDETGGVWMGDAESSDCEKLNRSSSRCKHSLKSSVSIRIVEENEVNLNKSDDTDEKELSFSQNSLLSQGCGSQGNMETLSMRNDIFEVFAADVPSVPRNSRNTIIRTNSMPHTSHRKLTVKPCEIDLSCSAPREDF